MRTPKIWAVSAGRGGVGKTVTSLALAYEFFLRGLRVGIVDLDTQGSLTAFLGQVRPIDPLTAPWVTAHGLRLVRGGTGYRQADVSEVSDLIDRAASDLDLLLLDCPPDLTSAQHRAAMSRPVDLVVAVALLAPGTTKLIRTLTGLCDRADVPYLVLPNRLTSFNNALVELGALRSIYGNRGVRTMHGEEVPAILPPIPADEKVGASITREAPFTQRSQRGTLPKRAAAAAKISALAEQLAAWGMV